MRKIVSIVVQTAIGLFVAFNAHGRAGVQHAVQHEKDQPDIRSNAAIVIDESNSSVLFARHAESAAPIASITKLMTAMVVLDASQPLNELITISEADRVGARGPSRLAVGAKLTRGDLLHLALMSSENRAAHAVGRSYPGGLPALLQAMNAKARTLGMTATHFADATGLSPDNVASPADLSKLVIAASRNEIIREYSTDDEYSVNINKREVEFRNTNYLVAKDDWDIVLQKTGFTNNAGRCLVMKTIIKGRTMVIVLLDSFGKYTRTADARRIKKWLEARASSAHVVT